VALGTVSAVLVAPELLGLASVLPFTQLVAFRPVACLGLLVLVGLVVLVRRHWWPAAVAVAIVGASALGAVLPRAVTGPIPPPGRTLTLLSFNVFNGSADVTALAAAIRARQPDLVILPEAGERYRRRLTPNLADLHYQSWSTTPPDQVAVDGIVVLASARLGQVTATPLDLGAEFRWLRLTGGELGDVTVVAVHTAAPVAGRMRSWANDLTLLHQWCADGPAPRVLVGDVNATLDHAPLRDATAGCIDAAAARGEGLVATWPTIWPRWFGVQIDHVFTSGEIHPASVQVLDLPGSDHRAIFTEIVLPPA
jgi:endonuclease/exonuclease/phosphatase (EEP) superfamily protein YafD